MTKLGKVCLVIVEGYSEQVFFEKFLCNFFPVLDVKYLIVNGDITSDQKQKRLKISTKIYRLMQRYLKSYGMRKSDIVQIIHIVDTDGVFIPDAQVYQDLSLKDFSYSLVSIAGPNREKILERNRFKKENLKQIIQLKAIRNIPYSVYFMSCNLEHVLLNIQNCPQNQKLIKISKFLNSIKTAEEFRDLFLHSPWAIISSYKESWNMIQKSVNSLNQYSNVGLIFKDLSTKK